MTKTKSYDKYDFEVLAGDFDSPFIRNYIWTKSFYKFSKIFGVSRPVVGISSKNNTVEYIGDVSTWVESHKDLKKIVENDNGFIDKQIDKTDELGRDFNAWSEDKIFKADLTRLNSAGLTGLLEDFIDKQDTLNAYGLLLPILDFQGFAFVEGNLEKFLKKKAKNSQEYAKYYALFTLPLHNSFAQNQEEDLLRLMKKFFSKDWIAAVKNDSLAELKKIFPLFYNALKSHAVKYGWVYYVYTGPAFNEEDFLGFIKSNLEKRINPDEKLKEYENGKKDAKRLRLQYIKELKPDKFNKMILNLASKMVWAKPRRKDYQGKSFFHLEKLQKEIAKRLNLSLNQVRSASVEIIKKSLKNNKIGSGVINSIFKFHVLVPQDNGSVAVLHGSEADQFYKKHIKAKIKEENFTNIKEIKGTIAYHGKKKGAVKIINYPSDIKKMTDGDILVSIATTPSIVPAMKKAGAIVTDEGGLTCHASIVSRELGIVCLVGTKIATKVLKDGDMVEVDAGKGIVKIIKKA